VPEAAAAHEAGGGSRARSHRRASETEQERGCRRGSRCSPADEQRGDGGGRQGRRNIGPPPRTPAHQVRRPRRPRRGWGRSVPRGAALLLCLRPDDVVHPAPAPPWPWRRRRWSSSPPSAVELRLRPTYSSHGGVASPAGVGSGEYSPASLLQAAAGPQGRDGAAAPPHADPAAPRGRAPAADGGGRVELVAAGSEGEGGTPAQRRCSGASEEELEGTTRREKREGEGAVVGLQRRPRIPGMRDG
jgi:hypothetical protein